MMKLKADKAAEEAAEAAEAAQKKAEKAAAQAKARDAFLDKNAEAWTANMPENLLHGYVQTQVQDIRRQLAQVESHEDSDSDSDSDSGDDE